MSLDDEQTTTREFMARQMEADRALQRAEWQERCLIESEEAEEARWDYRMRLAAAERPEVWYDDRPGYDRRLFAVDGDLPEARLRIIEVYGRGDPEGHSGFGSVYRNPESAGVARYSLAFIPFGALHPEVAS